MIEEINRRGGTDILFRKIQTNTYKRHERKGKSQMNAKIRG